MFLGENLLAWLMLALGGALAVGNTMAILRPPVDTRDGDLPVAPVGRSVVMALIGGFVAIWGLASLIRA